MDEVIAAGEEPSHWLVPLYRLAPRPVEGELRVSGAWV